MRDPQRSKISVPQETIGLTAERLKDDPLEATKPRHGGRRPGAGRPKKATKEKASPAEISAAISAIPKPMV